MAGTLYKCMLLVAAGLFAAGAQAELIYKWVDSDGVTHYAQHPPLDVEAEVFSPSGIAPAEEADDDDTLAEASETDAASDDTGPSTIDEFCEQIRQQLEVIETAEDIRVQAEDGTLERLEGERLEQRRQTLQAQIDQNC